ncbi:MAG: hypothetical protein U0K54_07365 [Acutalibacteraceae bacterium]|nr:hypothetical protein [Acutalibacteraceae bacterium]
MIKNVKKITALVLALLLCLVFTGCHKKGEIAVKVSYEDYKDEFTSGFYACALLYADMEGQQKVSQSATEEQLSSANFDYLKQKIDGKEYKDWVKARALEMCKEVFAYKVLCEMNKVQTADTLASASEFAASYWTSYYSEIMTPNGVGLETFKDYSAYQEYATAYFGFLYGEGGTKEVPKEEINKFLKEKYAYVNVLSLDISTLKEEEVEEKEKEYNKYLARLKKGENFGKIYAEANNEQYTANKNDSGIFNNDKATVWGAKDTMYDNDYFNNVAGLKNGQAKVFKVDDENGKYLILVVKGDIMQKGNTSLETLKDNVRHELKDDEFEKEITEFVKKITLNEVKFATKPFKVDKIQYPDYSY